MVSYPKDLSDLMTRFFTEEACRTYIEKLRWPDGYICVKCGNHKSWKTKRGLSVCSTCQYQQSPLAGTIFQDSRIPLRIWFQAIWWLTSQKNGASAQTLQRVLGMSGHEPAWLMLHKLRVAMIRPSRNRLAGQVEVDEAYLGGEGNKQLVGVAVEIKGTGSGRMRMQKLKGRTSADVKNFVQQHVEPGSTIITDGLTSYCCLADEGYEHNPMRKPDAWRDQDPDADELLPRVHRAISLVKRWLLGTYQGRLDHKYLDAYLNEFIFRFNRRTSRSRGLLFYRLLENSIAVEPAPLQKIQRTHKL